MGLSFAGNAWWLPAALVVGLAALLLLWSYRPHLSPPLRWLCGSLKLLGIAALALCLLEPLRSAQRVRPGANLFAIVVDNSESLRIKDNAAAQPRDALVRQWLGSPADGWQADLADPFEVRRYLFDGRLQGVTDFDPLTFDGRSSALGSALGTLAERLRGRPLAGVLLFTDGNATDLAGSPPSLDGLAPVYPVVVGRHEAIRDLSLAQVSVSQSAFEDQPVTIQVEATAPGFRGERIVARLRDPSGRVVEEHAHTVRGDGSSIPFRFQPRPDDLGLAFYEMLVLAQRDASATDRPTNTLQEATLANNSRFLAVDRGGGPYRILYVSGRPNWEFKFLNRAIETDAQVQLVALIRVAKREPRFEFRGRTGETSNPLFRGFGSQAPEEVERYDQPVLVRLNTRDELELAGGFPRTPEELSPYHAVVLDDLEAAFFAPDQALLLQKFVSERGGGVLMLGGMESFREGGYHRTPIGDMLPVYLDREVPTPPDTPLRYDLAREGWLQPWARTRDQESAERQRLDTMPPFLVANRVRGTKPGASLIATARDPAGHDHPALVVQRFGRGRVGALLVGDLWRWGMRDPAARADLDKSWRQLFRWLVSEVPERTELSVEPIPADPLGAVRLEARVRDPKFQPFDNATVTLDIEPVTFAPAATGAPAGSRPEAAPASQPIRLRAEPSPTEPGLYHATFLPRHPGAYRATASVTNELGAPYGRATAGWAHNPAADEFRSLLPNLPLLESIAQRTGGEIIRPEDLPAFVRSLPNRSAPIMESYARPLWNSPWIFAFALACFVTEWGIRRWKGLP
ncbi:MAG: hypothetical protein KF833_23450 [Verrucomicrobiae bacterium]|nr:hypothetical protein [Verrucomicrobiae bacterium]